MKHFSRLFAELDRSTATLAKVDALKRYFAAAEPRDAAWAVYFLAGGKPRQVVPNGVLWATACRRAGIDDWLFDACYQAVGDFAETVAHVLPPAARTSDVGLAEWVEERLLPLRGLAPEEQAARVAAYWDELDTSGRFLLNKLIGGGFRVGVSKLLVQRALAEGAGIDAKLVAQRMMGYTDGRATPSASRYAQLTASADVGPLDIGQPYPFFLAHQLDLPESEFAARLAAPADWIVEWKYDGIRAQVIKRAGQVWIWSRGEELVTERFPEIVALASALPNGTVLDGEIVVWKDGRVAPFNLLQQRIGRKVLTKKVLADAPVGFIAYDLLEWQGDDLRERPQHERRALLEAALASSDADGEGARASAGVNAAAAGRPCTSRRSRTAPNGPRSPSCAANRAPAASRASCSSTATRATAAAAGSRTTSPPAPGGSGRSIRSASTACSSTRRPATAAAPASTPTTPSRSGTAGRSMPPRPRRRSRRSPGASRPAKARSSSLPFAKAYSGLTDEEFKVVDRIIRSTTLEKFGPVRSVRPSLVFELGFEGINRSARHKSGIAVRFPRMLRIRDDKPLHEADSMAELESLLAVAGPTKTQI